MAELAEQLDDQLEDLETALAPVLSKGLNELAAGLDNLEQAKLHILLGYVIHDLSWIFLKTKGVDPNSHPVKAELDRIREYFAKLRAAEEKPAERTFRADKDVAARFIRHAIASGADAPPQAGPSKPPPKRQREPTPPVGTHSRFSFLAKPDEVPARPEESDEEMQVIDGEAQFSTESDEAEEEVPEEQPAKKKRKSAIQRASDRAAGLADDDTDTTNTDAGTSPVLAKPARTAQAAHQMLSYGKKGKGKAPAAAPKAGTRMTANQVIDLTEAPEAEARTETAEEKAARKARKAAKKARKAAELQDRQEDRAARKAAKKERKAAAEAQRAAAALQGAS